MAHAKLASKCGDICFFIILFAEEQQKRVNPPHPVHQVQRALARAPGGPQYLQTVAGSHFEHGSSGRDILHGGLCRPIG